MEIGMLWLGEDPEKAFSYYEKKYNKSPDTIECNPSHPLLKGAKTKSFEKFNLVGCRIITKGNLLVGCKQDKYEYGN